MINDAIVTKMKEVHEELKSIPTNDLKALISQGFKIMEEDEKAADSGIIRGHYNLTDQEHLAMKAASLYNIHSEPEGEADSDNADLFDEEE